ncbi:UDP-N-acetylmuramoyl-L-alanine--D-glutamate ligase [Buchnera aphidicola]|nr:UDP-N-acetylmuramoyl-L-alanine--D-glutamate ligase [Buchnera aphidicola]
MLILGMGLTGISCLHFFVSRKIYPKIMNFDSNSKYIKNIKLFKNITYHIGSINYEWIRESDLIIKSPGITLSHPALIYAHKKGIEIIGDIELFVRETNVPIIAITGSNGKSTVTTMVNNILQLSGLKVYMGGNIGIPALNILNHSAELYILELSSFQLETTSTLKPEIASVLNISPDHMNRYPLGMTEYRQKKLKIYNKAKLSILNLEDELSYNKDIKTRPNITFGVKKGEYHLKKIYNCIWLCYKSTKLLNTNKLLISGQHNYINALSALSIVHNLNIDIKISLKALQQFLGLPHRFQFVYKRNNVVWINDSKSTNIGSTQSAINNLLPYVIGKIRLILGGDGKLADFSLLKPYLKHENIIIYCYGKSQRTLSTLFPEKSMCLNTLKDTVYFIKKILKPHDIVLLSPACSSVDQFSNFEERGNVFMKLIKDIHQ